MFRIISLALTSLLLAGAATRLDGRRAGARRDRRFKKVHTSYYGRTA